jgi:hypothetical protein
MVMTAGSSAPRIYSIIGILERERRVRGNASERTIGDLIKLIDEETHPAMKTLSAADIEQAKLDPASVFHAPEDVLQASLASEDTKSILLRWEEDADALIRATDEGMEPSDNRRSPGELLAAIQAALETLEDSA